MTQIIRTGGGFASGAVLVDYHRHGRAIHDGIFSDDKLPLQYNFDKSKLPEIIEQGGAAFEIAKGAYEKKDFGDYKVIDNISNAKGLDATAYKHAKTGEIVIGICGIETENADGLADTVADVYGAFKSTAGAKDLNLDELLKFAEDISSKHRKIDSIVGHSLGGYQGMQLKVLADKSGFTKDDCCLHTYDIPGMTKGLAHQLERDYGITGADIDKSLKNENVFSWINDRNSFNTLGALPGNILTATDPRKAEYKEYAIDHLLPKGLL